MQLEQMSARISPRNPWQAMDLGVATWRQWWRPLTLIWVATTLPAFLVVMWLADTPYLLAAMLLFWWLKPVWERPLLAWCAQRLFDPEVRPLAIVRQSLRQIWRGLPGQLIWRRLDPARAVHMPVNLLENLSGKEYSQRVRALSMNGTSHGASLTLGLLHVEQGLAYGLTLLVMMLWPAQMQMEQVEWFFDTGSDWFLISLACWYAAMTITEPMYVCCGFTAYLNRRTWLEAWDLQLGLHRIKRKRQGVSALLVACLMVPLLGSPDSAMAAPAKTPRDQATEILASPQFMPMEIRDGWRFRELEQEDEEDDASWLQRLLEWLYSAEESDSTVALPDWLRHIDSPAEFLRLLLWCTVISLVLWLIWRYRVPLVHLLSQAVPAARPSPHLAGLDIRRESLPDDVAAHALAALEHGDTRAALALLYRATLSRLMEHHALPLAPGSTESECLEAFRNAAPADQGVALLGRLTPAWIACAWAHRPPAGEQVRDLVLGWSDCFEPSPGNAP